MGPPGTAQRIPLPTTVVRAPAGFLSELAILFPTMARTRSPIAVIVTMSLLGAVVGAIARFAFGAYVVSQEGMALSDVALELLLLDVLGLHWFAIYGLVGGGIFGVVLVLVDVLRYGARDHGYVPQNQVDIDPLADDKVKARRMEIGDRYVKENPPKDR